MKKERIDKVLSNIGIGSRKEVRDMIKSGCIEVDDTIISDASIHVDTETQIIKVRGSIIKYKKYIYIMMNKPKGVLSATEDNYCKTAFDLLSDEYKSFKPSPAGRLDKDTEGLLIMTNDGQILHKIISPKNHVPKKYYAQIAGVVDKSDILAFNNGIILDDGYKTMPGELEIKQSGNVSQVIVTIYEGKFHQIKRMFKALGKEVIYLKRFSIGSICLDESLELSEFRELYDYELKLLLHDCGIIDNINI